MQADSPTSGFVPLPGDGASDDATAGWGPPTPDLKSTGLHAPHRKTAATAAPWITRFPVTEIKQAPGE